MRQAQMTGLALLLTMPPGVAHCEDAPAVPLKDGDRVRVEASSVAPKPVVGQVLGTRDDGLRLKLKDGREMDLARADIRQLEVSRGRRSFAKRGAVIGALAGAAFVVAATIGEGGCDPDLGGCGLYFVAGAIYAAGGAGVGALIGSQVKTDRWERIPLAQAALYIGPAPGRGVAAGLSIAF